MLSIFFLYILVARQKSGLKLSIMHIRLEKGRLFTNYTFSFSVVVSATEQPLTDQLAADLWMRRLINNHKKEEGTFVL